jgi:selenocysteine-specific elongation factor
LADLVLGTAGHIDHGKTSLVRALTGVDTDRLPEEKARGITIELGFAPLDLAPGLRLGVVDVPGHEGLVRTMVAGATGIDLVLLVVAADEGVMPQTREHVAICGLLGIERGVVALTKIDAVDEDVADLAAEEVRGLVDLPLVKVSSLTGAGLGELRERLGEVASQAPPRTPRRGPPRLPVDRCFAMRGFGAVVTGTLLGGALRVGDAVEIQPGAIPARVRGLQSHGAAKPVIEPGSRCAVNLQGVELAALARGMVVTSPDALTPTRVLDVGVAWLPGAPRLEWQGAAIEFLAGTAERVGRIAPIGEGFARIHLQGEPVALLPGDRFVLRAFSRATIGGGTVLDVAPPHRRRSDPALRDGLAALARREPETDVRVRVARAGFAGASEGELRRETGLEVAAVLGALADVAPAGDRWLALDAVRELERRTLVAVAEFHAAEPLLPGIPRARLRGALPENAPPAALDLVLARQARALVAEGEWVRALDHAPRTSPAQQALLTRLRGESRAAGLEPPTLREWSERLGVDARPLLAHLEREGALVRAPGELWFSSDAVEALRARVVEWIRAHGPLDTPSYKKLIGTTRKHAVPLMELLDAQQLTLRRGETRVLRGAP